MNISLGVTDRAKSDSNCRYLFIFSMAEPMSRQPMIIGIICIKKRSKSTLKKKARIRTFSGKNSSTMSVF
jgi:hypothetical protein